MGTRVLISIPIQSQTDVSTRVSVNTRIVHHYLAGLSNFE